MRVLSLFSGGGLGDYGLELAGMEIVGQVEIDEYCQKILKLRWPDVPKWKEIREFKGDEVKGVDLVAGGFPCKNISSAGDKEGITGKESWLWKEMLRVIRVVRPRYTFVENVSALLNRGMDEVLGDLASIGFDAEWEMLPAYAFGAPHRRFRVWIIGYPNDKGEPTGPINDEAPWLQKTIPHHPSKRLERDAGAIIQGHGYRPAMCNWWSSEPSVDRVDDGTPRRMDRLKLLGNGQVPQVVEWIARRILEYDDLQRHK
jgi:DNA (cytosine-5)-methyltransferase 1